MSRTFLSKLVIVTIVCMSIGLIGFLALPYIIDLFLLPPLLKKSPFSLSQASITRITPYSITGSVELEEGGKSALSIPKFKLQYSPSSILAKRIDTLILEHAVIHLYREDDRWTLPGYREHSADDDSRSEVNAYLLPAGVDLLLMKRCLLVLHVPGQEELNIGISGQVKPSYANALKEHRLESISGSFVLSDDVAATATLSATIGKDQIAVQAAVQDAHLSIPESLLPDPLKSIDFNTFSADLDMLLETLSLAPTSYELKGEIDELRYDDKGVQISAGGSENPLLFFASGNGDEHTYKISSLTLSPPLKTKVNINGSARFNNNSAQSTGTVDALLAIENQRDSYQLPVSLAFSGSWSKDAGYRISTSGSLQPEKPLLLPEGLTGAPVTVGLEKLSFNAQLQSRDSHLEAEFNLQSKLLELQHQNFDLRSSDLHLHGILDRLKAKTTLVLDGSLSRLNFPEQQITLTGVDFSLPVALPAPDTNKPGSGSLKIDSVELNHEQLFSVATDIELRGSSYQAAGRIAALINPDARLSFTATVPLPLNSADISWELAALRVTPGSLPTFAALAPGLDFEAVLAASGKISITGPHLSARMQASIADGVVEFGEKNIRIEDIDCSIEFPDLPNLRTSPSQRCSVTTADISSLHFSDAEVTFRLEDSQALFIEKSLIRWCDGTLESGSLRLSKKIPEIDTTFYCSRINLGKLLEQFGFKGTQGEGSLNGKLPVKISRNSIEFDDGFLFSTPGAGGIVRFTDTDLLRQGIGAASEAGYINYSLKALEDFTYNWTKLTFDSAGDELLLTLELDGKPSTALPFKFNKNGVIVESEQGTGLQYPIRLDVNFRLPLAELFQVGQSINTIMGNNQ